MGKSSADDPAALLKRERKRIHDQIEKGFLIILFHNKLKNKNNLILTELRADEKRRQKEHRILLLGCGEAGKSTFIKQMRIIHSDGFSQGERRAFK